MQVTVKNTNGKGIEALQKRLIKATADVGILTGEGKHAGSGKTVAEIGMAHEFGTQTLPERSFIRSTIQDKANEIKQLTIKEYKKVLSGKTTTKQGLGIIGAYVAGQIQKTFVSNNWQPNSQATVMSKGSSTPLIDTGQLRQSISWKVNDNAK